MRRLVPVLAVLFFAATRPAAAQEALPASNMRVYQLLAARIGDSLDVHLPQEDSLRILVAMKPEATAWLVQGDIARALQRGGHTVVVAMPAVYQADLGILEMHVAYGNVRTEGMFTGKVADREVLLIMGARLVDQRSGIVTLTREFRETMEDTVRVTDIPTLEDPNVPITQGSLPGEGFFSSLVEPLIMLGAVAVAVYLLFTVKS